MEEILQGGGHHDLAVLPSVILAPEHIRNVGLELRGPFEKISQVGVFQGLVLGLRQFDVTVCELVANAAGAGVQDQPHRIGLIQTDFQEVVARSERAKLLASRTGKVVR